jgi:hypothetical protein
MSRFGHFVMSANYYIRMQILELPTLQIYTVFSCVPLSTVISLYGLHLIALYSPM